MKRRPTDYECEASPHNRLVMGRFVRGSLTLADPAELRFSLLCATNVPQDHEAFGLLPGLDRSPQDHQKRASVRQLCQEVAQFGAEAG